MRAIELLLAIGVAAPLGAQETLSLSLASKSAEGPAREHPSDAILGFWLLSQEKTSILIEVVRDSIGYSAAIRSIRSTAPRPDDNAQLCRLDRNNPDPALRALPVVGMTVLSGLRYRDGAWRDGRIYSPDNGKTYHAWARIEQGSLRVKGYLKIGFIKVGRSTSLERVAVEYPADSPDHTRVTAAGNVAPTDGRSNRCG